MCLIEKFPLCSIYFSSQFFPFGYTSTPCVPFLLSRNTRGYFSFHCSRLATQARHACLFCCRETRVGTSVSIVPVWLHKHAMRAFFVVEKHAWVLQFPLFPFGYTSTPCVPFLLSRNTRVGTYHLHGKTGNSGLKIKWFPSLRLGSFRNYGL